MPDWREDLDSYLDAKCDELIQFRRHIHKHPEPSGEEQETARFIAHELARQGAPQRLVLDDRGVLVQSDESGEPRIGFRADIDSLRLQDEKDTEYRSSRAGCMHGCGHDAHATMAFGAALGLQHVKDELPWPAAWTGLFQPSEETAKGAFEMIDAGALEGVKNIIAYHVDPQLCVGHVAICSGPLTACCDELAVTIFGQGGHAARPHHTTDPIAVSTQFVQSVYQFIPRTIDSRMPAVVSFGTIRGGDASNVIPDKVELGGTIRTLSRNATDKVREKIRHIAHGLSEASGTDIEVRFLGGPDAVINDSEVTDVFALAAKEVVGKAAVNQIDLPSMGGEDFAGYLDHVPGALMRIGVAPPTGPETVLHSPTFDIDENALLIGAKIMARAVILLARPDTAPD